MNILVTGAAGLLGSRYIEWLRANKPDVNIFAVDDLSGGYISNLPADGIAFKQLDVGSKDMETIFQGWNFHYVVHLAAYAAECVSPFIRKFNYNNNLIATANLINLSIKYGVKRFVFTSSMAVYGHAEPPFSEEMIPCPNDPYGIAKYACEMDLRVAGEQHGLDWCIIRPHNVFGRNQNIWDSYRNFIGIAIYKGIVGDPITIYGDGEQRRAFSCIDDSLEPIWIAMTDPKASKQIINLGGINDYSIKEAAHTLIEIMDGGDMVFLPPRHEVRNAWSTHQKSVELLGFEHKTSLYDGIKDMWNWAIIQPKRPRFVWNNYELEVGLYPQWKPEALQDGYWKNNIPPKLS